MITVIYFISSGSQSSAFFMVKTMISTSEIGQQTEIFVSDFLEKSGYKILDRNFRSQLGEIDIIAFKDKEISFVEVKKMISSWQISDISRKVDNIKQFKIKSSASYYLAQNKDIKYDLISFDVAAVYGNRIEYFKGAF